MRLRCRTRVFFERLFNQDVVQEKRVRQRGRTDGALLHKSDACLRSDTPFENFVFFGDPVLPTTTSRSRRGPRFREGGMLYLIIYSVSAINFLVDSIMNPPILADQEVQLRK